MLVIAAAVVKAGPMTDLTHLVYSDLRCRQIGFLIEQRAMKETAMQRLIIAFSLLLSAFGLSAAAQAGEDQIYTGLFNNRAAGGYDVVSYFTDGKPVKGDKKFQTDYRGAEWRFSSQAHLEAFLADPEKYAPQYGGYCAWAMGRGYAAKGDPEVWRIVDGKLYLNYDESVREKWEVDIPGFIAKANVNYPNLVDLD